MTVADILTYPNPALRQASAPVSTFDRSVSELADKLIDTLHATEGIGLSAVQIGVHQQVLVMDHSGDGSAPEVYINPEILKRERYGLVEERCLSVPGVVAHVLRATRIVVRAQKVDGSPFESTLSDMPAVCLQHELDHFDGKLVVDRLNWFKRRRLRKALVQQGVDLASA